jgi:phage terminase large subunit-like protein
MMRMRILAGLYIFGEAEIIGIAQSRILSLDTFKKVVQLANQLQWMRERIKRVSQTNGQEELEVYCEHYPMDCPHPCAQIRKYSIRAATSEGPRGATADLLYVDELREISEQAWGAVTPITRARPNSQIWVTSNAGDSTSTVLNDLRSRALTTDSPRIGWYEWSAPPGSKVDDIKAWQAANPALGYFITAEKIATAALTDKPDVFKTEALSMWIDAIENPFPTEKWNAGEADVSLEDNLPTWMGLDLSFDRTRAFLVTVQQRKESGFNVFLHEWQKENPINDVELAGDIATITRQYRPRVFAYDPNTSGYLAPTLARAGIPVAPTPWSSAGFSIMCDQLLNAMSNGDLYHPGQKTMHEHLVSCAKRPASDGGWRIARRAAANPIGAAVALVMAIGHATTPQATVSIASA